MGKKSTKPLIVLGLICCLLVLSLAVLPGHFIGTLIERLGAQAVGAEVNVKNVDVSWFPLQVIVSDLQVTDPAGPDDNLIRVTRISSHINLGKLFFGKVYLEHVLLDGIAVGSSRDHRGFVLADASSGSFATGNQSYSLPVFDLPDSDAIIENEKALYKRKIDEVTAEIEIKRQRWENLVEDLPGKEKFEGYKQRLKNLKESKSLLAGWQALTDLKNTERDIRKDLEQIKRTRQLIDAEYVQLQQGVNRLKSLPNQSLDQIVSQLGLSDSRIAGLGKALMEGRFRRWLDQGYRIFGRPDAGVGEEEAAVNHDGQPDSSTGPDFVIRRMRLTGPFTLKGMGGEISGEMKNFSDAPGLMVEPISLDVLVDSEDLGTISLVTDIDHRSGRTTRDTLHLKITDTRVSGFLLSDDEQLKLLLSEVLVNLEVSVELIDLSKTNITIAGRLADMVLEASPGPAGNSSGIEGALADAIESLEFMTFAGTVTGTLDNPVLAVETNFDAVVSRVVSETLRKRMGVFEAELQERLNRELQDSLGSVNRGMSDIGNLVQAAGIREEEINGLLRKLL